MIRRVPVVLVAFVLALVAAAPVWSQNLLADNPHARRAQSLRQEAQRSIEAGEYDRAVELTEEAQRESEQAVVWAEEQVWAFRANSMRNRAREQMVYANRIDAATHYPQEYALARETMESAEENYSARRFEDAFTGFRLVRDTISPLQPVRVAREPEPQMVTTPVPQREPPRREPPPEEPVLPRYYVVRLIPEDRDTFNKIAGYDFVYGDRFEWRRLYEANRHLLQDPDNPHLIQPGMRFEIPSIRGEERAGVWQPPGE